jgi:hypothetical protein
MSALLWGVSAIPSPLSPVLGIAASGFALAAAGMSMEG